MDYTFKIQFGDTDPAGIVYYPNYYRWMDAATHELFDKIGFSTKSQLEHNMTMPLVEAHCVFKSPGYYHHIITVKSEIEFVKNKVFKLLHRFYDGDKLLAEGYEIRAWVEIDGAKLTSISIPDDIQTALQKLVRAYT